MNDQCIYKQSYMKPWILNYHCYNSLECYIYVELLNQFTVRYHRCYAPRYRLDEIYIYHQSQLPINPHCGFPCAARQLGKSYVRKKVMCGPHASFYSSVASHPTLPTPPVLLNTHRYYFYNLGWKRLYQELECARQSTKIEDQPFLFR